MSISLPEERVRLVQVTGVDDEPVSLDVDDNVMAFDKQRAKEVYAGGVRFAPEERDRILARLALGL